MMKLAFKRNHLSISHGNFDLGDIALPDFVVLTGVNGSGKSHLLEAIENGSVAMVGDGNQKIVRFDYRDFFLENESAYNARQIIEERGNAWNFLQSNVRGQAEAFRNQLGTDYARLVEISNASGRAFLSLGDGEIVDVALLSRYRQYQRDITNFFKEPRFKNNQQMQSVVSVAEKVSQSVDDLDQDEFNEYFQPYHLKKDFLPNQLGKVIWDYFLRYRSNEVNEFMNTKYGKHYPVMTGQEFEKRHGGKPWDVINRILGRFNSVDYHMPSPEGHDYFGDYQVRLQHKGGGFEIDFAALSSGEKVLMALIAAIYKLSTDRQFPDVLLLDEIDASLHPSMMKNVLETIDEIFLGRGTKVILVTHSPTTVALAPDESVYVMNKGGIPRVEKKSKNEALRILTEGFATLDEGLRIFDEISRQNLSIISEGNNVEYLKKALELHAITDVEVICGVKSRTGKEQLNTLFDFLSRISHDKKKVMIIWDPDVTNTLQATNNTIPYILPKNDSNTLIERGIENLFDPSLFTGFTAKSRDSYGVESEHFDSNRKKDFMNFVLGRSNLDDFKNFKPLVDEIKKLK